MKPRGHPLRPTQHLRISERAPLGTPSHERLMLLELATDLQTWPTRSAVFRTALDRAADDLVRMASGSDQP